MTLPLPASPRPASAPTRWIAIVPVLLALAGCATVARNDPSNLRPGESAVFATGERHGPFGRTYRLHLPAGLEPGDDRPRPLVVALHGGVATARIFEQQTGFSTLADEEGFLVLYPNGIGVLSLFRHWNAGWCCAKAMEDGVDDVAFVSRLVERVAGQWPVDRERIYVVGYSNGGMLAHEVALAGAFPVAGLGVFAGPVGPTTAAGDSRPGGSNGGRPGAAEPPFPVVVVHGTDDDRLSVDGSAPDRRGNRLPGAIDTARFWARRNGCVDSEGAVEEPRRTSPPVPGVERLVFCPDGAATVRVDLLEGWGHEWPGPRGTGRLETPHELAGYDAALAMWNVLRSR